MRLSAIVPAAGASRRMGRGVDKLYRSLQGKPLLIHSLLSLEKAPWVKGIVLVVARRRLRLAKRLVGRYRLRKIRGIYPGGRTRAESVALGMRQIDPRADYVLVHDGARPLLRSGLLNRVMKAARKNGAAIPALPVGPTIKEVNPTGFVVKTLPRRRLWEVQTPQIFRRAHLARALERSWVRREEATDCASLVERSGHRVKVVLGDPMNLKVTTPMDFIVAEALLKKS